MYGRKLVRKPFGPVEGHERLIGDVAFVKLVGVCHFVDPDTGQPIAALRGS